MGKLALTGGTPFRTEPFHKWPIYDETERDNLTQVLQKSKWGVGKRTGVINEFEEQFAKFHNAPYAVACSNCTHALEICLAVHGIGKGDEVIVPAYTFIATASAVRKVGATVVFADIDDTYTMDPTKLEKLITKKTKAIIPVHFSGHFASMEKIQQIATKYNLKVVEDAAQAHGARWLDISPGEYGPACFSFQYSKNMTAGEGGIIISHDEDFIEKCWEHIWHGRQKGGLWYEHFETTSNFRMTEWSAAVLLAQLERLEDQNKLRMENAEYLTELLKKDGFLLPTKVDEDVTVHPRHLFMMKLNRHPDLFGDLDKEKIIEALQAEGLPIVGGYKFPLYKNPVFQEEKKYKKLNLLNSEKACQDTLWIIHNILLGTKKDIEDIANGIKKVVQNISELK